VQSRPVKLKAGLRRRLTIQFFRRIDWGGDARVHGERIESQRVTAGIAFECDPAFAIGGVHVLADGQATVGPDAE